MFKKLSSKSKILLGITVVAVVGAVAVLIVIMATGGNKTNPPGGDDSTPGVSTTASGETSEPANSNQTTSGNSQIGDNGLDDTDLSALIAALPGKEALDEIHSLFSGYWISGDPFVGFVYIDGEPGIDYGLFQTSFGACGKITDACAVSAHEVTLTVYIPAVPATEMDPDGSPERTDTVYIDISNYNDNRLNIKIDGLAGGEWRTYEYGGGSLEDAFNNR